MSEEHFTVRGLLRGTVSSLDDEEVSLVNRAFLLSFVVALVAAVIAYFTVLEDGDTLSSRLYGFAGVVLVVTVFLGLILNLALVLRRRIVRYRRRWRG
jgi:hypothetical protein